MPSQTYQIRLMQRQDLDTVLQWAAQEGWNPGLHDAECFLTADPHGFLLGELDGEPIASISAVRYSADFGFLGLYIVKPEYRGQGYGTRLWQAAMTRFGGSAIGLDGVVAQQENYRRAGFTLAHRNIRYQGRAVKKPLEDDAGVVPLSQVPARLILSYDRPFFPAGRTAFLRAWLHQPGAHAFGLMQDDELAGYGLIRPCQTGYKIGPLYAEHPLGAASLLVALMQCVPPGSPVLLDIPETNVSALTLARHYGMVPVFETARMYKGSLTLPDMARTYGITTFELG